jgi:hypothetical protein
MQALTRIADLGCERGLDIEVDVFLVERPGKPPARISLSNSAMPP